MSIKWDKEKIILSVAGSLAVVVVGYLVWRHEQSVAVSTIKEEQNAEDTQDAELQQELQSLPQYTAGGGASDESDDTGSDSAIASPPTDDSISQILAAFYPNGTSTGASNPTTGTPQGGTPPTHAGASGAGYPIVERPPLRAPIITNPTPQTTT
jgi:hypothetical protein